MSLSKVISAAERTNNSDGFKYQSAVDLARQELAGQENVKDRDFRNLVDTKFLELKPTEGITGADMRGEDGATQLVRGAKDTIEDFNTGVGSSLDWIFDNTIGALGYNVGLGDYWKNMFSGEDAGIVADIGSDILLSAIPGAGIPLVVAKNAIQQSDNIWEAATGRDDITLEKLEEGQGTMKGLEAALTMGLSALPGVGRLGNLARTGRQVDDVAREAAELAETAKNVPAGQSMNEAKALADAANTEAKTMKDAIGRRSLADTIKGLPEIPGTLKTGAKNRIDAARTGFKDAKNVMSRDSRADIRQAKKELKGTELAKDSQEYADLTAQAKVKPRRQALSNVRQGLRGGKYPVPNSRAGRREVLRGLEMGIEPPKQGFIGDMVRGGLSNAAGVPLAFGNMSVASAAENGTDLHTGLNDTIHQFAENPGAALPLLLPLGTKSLGRRNSGLRGAAQYMKPSNIGWNAARAASAGNYMGQQQNANQMENQEAPSIESILEYLANNVQIPNAPVR
jgi:hypothetical protein